MRCRGRRCCRRPPRAAGRGGGGCRPRDVIWAPPPAPLPVRAAPRPARPAPLPGSPPHHPFHPPPPSRSRPVPAPAAPESWLPPAAASMHPALYTRASMIREIAAAVGFISKFLRTKGLMNERQLQTFSQSLQELLAGEGGAGVRRGPLPSHPTTHPLPGSGRGAALPPPPRDRRGCRRRQRRAPRAAEGRGGGGG